MTKVEYLSRLEHQLAGLPETDLQRIIDYYNEIIDDRMEDTGNEAEAVAAMDAPEVIATQALADFPLPKLVKQKISPRRMAGWEIVLLVLGSPIWLSLLIAAFAILVSLYAAVFSVVISLFAVSVACGGIVIGGAVYSVLFFIEGRWIPGLFYLGVLLVCVGLAVYLWWLAVLLPKGIIRLTKGIALGIKRRMVKKEA